MQVAQGDLAGAFKSYQDDLAIARRLAQSYPGNAILQRDLSAWRTTRSATCRWRKAILRAHSSPTKTVSPLPTGWRNPIRATLSAQRDLSVSYIKVGDVQVAQGDLAAALKSYRNSLAIRDRLAKADPGNADGQRDLSVAYERVGDVQVAQGDVAGALKSYRDSLAIFEPLAKSDPSNAGWQRDLSVLYERVGDVQVAQGDLAGALEVLQRQPRHQRPAGESRFRQRRLAARSGGLAHQGG